MIWQKQQEEYAHYIGINIINKKDGIKRHRQCSAHWNKLPPE